MDILSSILSQKISDKSDRESDFQRVFWFTHVMQWMQRPREDEKDTKKETVYTVRLKYLLLQLNNNPEWKLHFVSNLTLLLSKISSADQLSLAGLPGTHGFLQEFLRRIQEKILPSPPLSEDLSSLIEAVFSDENESLYIDFIDESVLVELFELFKFQHELFHRLRTDLIAASYILSHQIMEYSLMIQRELNDLSSDIGQLSEFQLEGLLRQQQINPERTLPYEAFHILVAVEEHRQQLYIKMKQRGVKIELVYLFQIQKRKINRLRLLLQFLNPEVSSVITFRQFISRLILETRHQKSMRSFFSENLTLLTDRIVEANSTIGEHYVTYNWSDFRRMFQSALGGGGITSVTVIIKHFTAQIGLSGFIKGLADSFNYSGSFLMIQLMGWTLATKQPSATAPYIASALQTSTTEARKSIVALLRTQFIAVFGNLSLVFPICFFLSWLSLKFDNPLYSKEDAYYALHSSDLLGFSALFAAFTGVLLFVASLIAGGFENWILVNRIDKRIKYNPRLQSLFGSARTQRFGQVLVENANPLAANIGLGFLLGMTPQFMKFFGLPLEARHVTLATGGFAAALPVALQNGITNFEMANSAVGILVIGMLNLSVSFSLAFLLASISSKVSFSSLWRLTKWGFWLIVTRPWLLIIPEKQKEKQDT